MIDDGGNNDGVCCAATRFDTDTDFLDSTSIDIDIDVNSDVVAIDSISETMIDFGIFLGSSSIDTTCLVNTDDDDDNGSFVGGNDVLSSLVVLELMLVMIQTL